MRQLLPLLLLLALPACGGSGDPKERTASGYASLGSNDHQAALADFRSALESIGSDPSHPEYMNARLGLVQAQIELDSAAAKESFLALATDQPSRVTDRDFSMIGGKFASAGELGDAIAVLDAGMKAHAESPHLKALLERIKGDAERAGDAGALGALESLGYL